jgi:hypothetical protein
MSRTRDAWGLSHDRGNGPPERSVPDNRSSLDLAKNLTGDDESSCGLESSWRLVASAHPAKRS